MTALYELAETRLTLDRKLYETEGELTPELEAELDGLDVAVDEKIERVALYIREQLAAADVVKAEEERLARKRHAHVNAADSLRAYLQRCMTTLGKEDVRGRFVRVTLAENPPSVRGELDSAQLAQIANTQPELVKYVPESWVLDRRAVLAHVRAGNAAPDGLTITREPSLRIR